MTTSKPWLPLAAALVSVCLWAGGFVGIRAAGRAFSPGALALGRLTLGSLLLGALVLARAWTRPSGRDLALLFLAGFTWFGSYAVALNQAERSVDAGTASMLIMIAPIVVVALAAAFLKERFTKHLVAGSVVAFAGVLLIGFATSTGNATLAGVLLCLLAAVASAIGLVAQKPVLGRLSALQVTWTCCTVGALVCAPYAPLLARELRSAPGSAVAWLVFLGVFPTSVAFTTWAYALARGTAGRVVAITYLVPPVTILMSWAILGEIPRFVAVIGGGLCFAGVYITRRQPQ